METFANRRAIEQRDIADSIYATLEADRGASDETRAATISSLSEIYEIDADILRAAMENANVESENEIFNALTEQRRTQTAQASAANQTATQLTDAQEQQLESMESIRTLLASAGVSNARVEALMTQIRDRLPADGLQDVNVTLSSDGTDIVLDGEVLASIMLEHLATGRAETRTGPNVSVMVAQV
jgi:small-conductance mechanosensitive channel